jgi:CxxC-x17-CxxC domain-containing protein
MKSKGIKATTPAPSELGATASEAPDIPDFADVASEPQPADDFGGTAIPVSGEKPRFTGNWECATCGGEITSLPFQPKDTSNLKCRDCFKQSRSN